MGYKETGSLNWTSENQPGLKNALRGFNMCQCKSQEHLGNFGNCPQCRTTNQDPTKSPKAKPMAHPHAALIKEWADDCTAQWQYLNINTKEWDIPKPDIVLLGRADARGVEEFSLFETFAGATDNLQLTFDGETGKLKDAKVIA